MEEAISLALGQPLLGHFPVVGRRKVLVIDLENPEEEFYWRVPRSRLRRGLADGAMDPYFICYDQRETTERFYFNPLQLERMKKTLAQEEPAFVVVDNLRRGMPAGKDENVNAEMIPIMRAM